MSKPRFVPRSGEDAGRQQFKRRGGRRTASPPADAGNPDQSGGGAATADTAVRHDGFGKLKVGMTVAQASQALGVAPDRE